MAHAARPTATAIAVAFAANAFCQETFAQTTLNEVVVNAARMREASTPAQVGADDIAAQHAIVRDTASLLRDVPGISLQGAGGISSLPAIHGLADDRLRVSVDGMDLISSCPNHMNPPLSYLDPANVARIKVYAGISPVSAGGDSIGGSIIAETPDPQFAAPGQGLLAKGEIGGFARSNSKALGTNASATLASETLSITYSGAYAQADNYRAGGNFKTATATGRPGHALPRDEVGSTAYESRTHTLGFAARSGNHLFEAKFGYQEVPYQLYPNQRMDMLDNTQQRVNLRYLGQYDWGLLEARAYHEKVDHYMNFGADKQLAYGSAVNGMPMNSRGSTTGLNLKADIDLSANDLLRVGALYQHYTLRDWWPPSGTGGMAPLEFLNIEDGQRDRLGLFGEWEKRLGKQWTTLVGARYERVSTNAGAVHGYGNAMGSQLPDAAAFNARDRRRADDNIDLSALARYTPDATSDIEFGLARKVRSPNLYERYTWSTWSMAAVMNNFAGDGNGYVGNPDLKPETAHTASLSLDWHSPDRQRTLKITPYYTLVDNYIDAVRCRGGACAAANATATNRFVVLRYANQSARLYGVDLSGRTSLADTSAGEFGLRGLVNYTRGENRDTGDNLYNIMPLNARLTLTHRLGSWNSAIEWQGVAGKKDVSGVRNEIGTAGYSLVHLRASYTWQNVRLDFGIENLFDRLYALPTGGAYTGQGTTMSINGIPWGIAVPGMGRSFYAGVNLKF